MKRISNKDGIAPWKIDSPVERWLSKKADNSAFWRRAYVNYYKTFDKDYYKKGLKFIDKNIAIFVGEVTPEEREQYVIDMVYSLHRFGCMFDEYFMYGYKHLNAEGRESFITDKIRWNYYDIMNSRDNLALFNDKLKTYEKFKKFYKREVIGVSCDEDFDNFERLFNENDKLLVKPIDGSGGVGIFLMKKADYADAREAFAAVRAVGRAVVEQLIVQSKELAVLNSSSVNTVRAPMFKTRDGIIILHPYIRSGRGDTVVDNAAAGGVFAVIDAKTGIVETVGVDEHGGRYVKHPTTGVVIPGFQIPRWDELVELVNELSGVVETNNFIGWDLALTDDGWVMIEGNPRGQLVFQIAREKGAKAELEDIISRM